MPVSPETFIPQPHAVLPASAPIATASALPEAMRTTAVGLAVPDLPTWIAVPLVFGTIMNPLGFLPLAFSEEQRRKAYYRVIITLSFIGTSGGLTAAAVFAL